MGCMYIFAFILFASCFGYPEDGRIARARIESCTGCALAKYPEVKKFIEHDIQDFENVAFKQVPGLFPELVFFNMYDQELERHPLRCKYHEECSQLLVQKGFKRNSKTPEGSCVHNDI